MAIRERIDQLIVDLNRQRQAIQDRAQAEMQEITRKITLLNRSRARFDDDVEAVIDELKLLK